MKVQKPINDGSVVIAYLHTNFNSKSKNVCFLRKHIYYYWFVSFSILKNY